LCFDAASGAQLWKHSYDAPLSDMYFEGGTTGHTDDHEGKVFHLSREGEVVCLELATGKVVWQSNPAQELEATKPDWGYAASPLVEGNLLILNLGGAGPRSTAPRGRPCGSHAQHGGVCHAGSVRPQRATLPDIARPQECMAIEAANGNVLWRQKFVSGYNTSAGSPVIHDDTVLLSAYDVPAMKLDLRTGKSIPGWKTDTRVHFNAGVVVGGYYYAFHGEAGKRGGELRCLDWKTGATKWKRQQLGFGSLIAADGKLILLSEKRRMAVAECRRRSSRPLSRAQILAGNAGPHRAATADSTRATRRAISYAWMRRK